MKTPAPILFQIGGITVRWYGVCIAMGVLLAALILSKREERYALSKDASIDMLLWLLPAGVIGARIYYVAFEWKSFADDPLSALYLWQGGLAIYGGIIAGALTLHLFCRKRRYAYSRMLDFAAPAIAIGQCCGRWGNFFNQEAYGIAVTDPALQFFPAAVWIEANQAWHAATFFYESTWCLALCIALLILERAWKDRRNGDIFTLYALGYGLERTVVEGLRTDSLYFGRFRVSQVLSVAAVAVCVILLCIRHNAAKGKRI